MYVTPETKAEIQDIVKFTEEQLEKMKDVACILLFKNFYWKFLLFYGKTYYKCPQHVQIWTYVGSA